MAHTIVGGLENRALDQASKSNARNETAELAWWESATTHSPLSNATSRSGTWPSAATICPPPPPPPRESWRLCTLCQKNGRTSLLMLFSSPGWVSRPWVWSQGSGSHLGPVGSDKEAWGMSSQASTFGGVAVRTQKARPSSNRARMLDKCLATWTW